jgi:hypothetical protein
MLDLIKTTPEDVKEAMGLAIADTTLDEQISAKLRTRGPLILEDYFSVEDITMMTPNQRERAKVGLATVIAGEVLQTSGLSPVMNAGSSFSIGPISLGGFSGGGNVTNLVRIATNLKREGADILDTLRLANQNPMMGVWGAVGTTRRPTVVGGPRC